jgi:hypothetical protein
MWFNRTAHKKSMQGSSLMMEIVLELCHRIYVSVD